MIRKCKCFENLNFENVVVLRMLMYFMFSLNLVEIIVNVLFLIGYLLRLGKWVFVGCESEIC